MTTRAKFDLQKRPILIIGSALLLCIVMVISVSGFAVDAGFRIFFQEDLQRDYLYGALWAIAIAAFIAAWPVNHHDKINLLIAWMAKSYTALVFMLFYERHYETDSIGYFFLMRRPFFEWSWNERVRSFHLVALVGWVQERFIDSFHAAKLTFALIGLVAVYLVYRAAMSVIGRSHSDALLVLALFPSTLFWSSIISKDPIVFFGVSLYVYGVCKWRATGKTWFILVFAAGIVLATFMRAWLGLILGIPLVFLAMRGVRRYASKVAFIVVSAALIMAVLPQFAARMNVESADELLSATDRIAHQFSGSRTGASGSTRDMTTNFTSIPLLVAFLPIGIFTTLYRPLPGEVGNIFGILAGLENAALLYWSARALLSLIRDPAVRKPLRREPVIIWAVVLVLLWSAFYGFVSFQNLGAAVRFRLPIVSVFVGLLLAVTWVERQVKAMRAATPRRVLITRAPLPGEMPSPAQP